LACEQQTDRQCSSKTSYYAESKTSLRIT